MEEWLDDMIYCGDIEGYIRRRSKDVVTDDFREYLDERLEACHDQDEKQVLSEIALMVGEKLRISDGLADSEEVFESRLDRVLFTAPNQRKAFIKENIEEMSLGFVEFVQREMKETADGDSKVVFASILQLIGQVKGADLLGSFAGILAGADSSLGDQFAPASSPLLDGVGNLDEAKEEGTKLGDKNEQILASLLFSENDILEDVLNNLHEIDENFIKFLQNKIDTSKDMEERIGLGSLLDTVNNVLERVKEVQGDGEVAIRDQELTLEEVKGRMMEVQAGQDIDEAGKPINKFGAFAVDSDKKDSFQSIMKRFQGTTENYSLEEAVEEHYDLCDYEFMNMLKSEVDACYAEGADIEAKEYETLLETVNIVMVKRIGGAQDRLKRILDKRTLPAMETELVAMIRRNEVDEALILLIEANIQQAELAGANQAVEVLKRLNKRINDDKDKKLPDEVRLLRALMRIEVSEERKGLLYDAFKAQKIMTEEEGVTDGPPLISPPMFINTVRQFIQSFGNIDAFNIMDRALAVIDEAQVVATDLYGSGMTKREQQQMMFEKKSISVWDLASYEEKSLLSGEDVPWKNDAYDDKGPDEVLGDRVRRVGGQDQYDADLDPNTYL
eukprot:CAMPEP_0119051438 /NCGR_PEP_ID=MMETSP1177-20130426/73051_1 /TAXON_ID=2985 /ORGANISM="Ochromonas sp, Strain CCMP1899" /LENGTH=615 /DNA_ID=CAMNT_0007030637 /DNA_START=289 /DNA_END=2136 /DNA_ORIENTATION=+